METHHRRALNRCMNDLTENLNPSDVFPYLISSGIMSFDDNERINHERNTQKKAVFLFVPLLQRKGPNAFKEFLRALEQHNTYEYLVDKLQEEADLLIGQRSDDKDAEGSVMRSYHKKTLRTFFGKLHEYLNVDEVMSHMITKEIMTHDDREKFDKRLTGADKVDEFLLTLLTKGGDAFDVFVEALKKYQFYSGLVSMLTEQAESDKAIFDKCLEELVNETKDGESHDFTSLKESIADRLGRRDAFDLCEHFELDKNCIGQSEHPALSVVTLLCKENKLLQDNMHNFLATLEDLPLQDVKTVVQAYNTKRENGVEITITVELQVNPPSTEGNDEIRDRIKSKLRNKLWAFKIGKRLSILFQRLYGIQYKRLEEGSIILQLVILTTTALQKLNSDIENGTVAKLLLPELFPEGDVDITQIDGTTSNVTLEVRLEKARYNSAMDQLIELEKRVDKADTCGDTDRSVLERFAKKIGVWRDPPRNLNLRSWYLESHTPSPCNTFLRNIPKLCLRSGFSENLTGERYNMRDFIYTILIYSETSVRRKIITEIDSSNMAVPLLLTGIAERGPELLQWVPSIIDKTGKEEGKGWSSFFESSLIVSVVRIGETRLSKSSFLNTLYQFTQKRVVPSAFLINDNTFPRPSFSQGCVEVVTAPSNGTGDFPGVISFLNLRGDCTKFKAQRQFLIKVSNLIIAFIDKTSVADHKHAIDEIKTKSQNAIIVEVKQTDSYPAYEKNYRLDRRQQSILVDVIQLDVLCEEIHKEIIQCGEECKTIGNLEHFDVASCCENMGIIVETERSIHHISIKNDQSTEPFEIQEQEEQECNTFYLKEHSFSTEPDAYTNEKNHDENVQIDDIAHYVISPLLKSPAMNSAKPDLPGEKSGFFLILTPTHYSLNFGKINKNMTISRNANNVFDLFYFLNLLNIPSQKK